MKISAYECRNQNDFLYGSFVCHVKKDEIIIKGKLKKTKRTSIYMKIFRNKKKVLLIDSGNLRVEG